MLSSAIKGTACLGKSFVRMGLVFGLHSSLLELLDRS